MKILLDENLDTRLRLEVPLPHEAHSVKWVGWSGKLNGELLQLMAENEYAILVTADKNLHFQQSLSRFPVTVILLDTPSLTRRDVLPLFKKAMGLMGGEIAKGLIVVD